MAESVQELIVKYKADISDLVAKIDAIEKELLQTEQAAENSGKAIGTSLNRQVGLVENLSRKLELLRQARDKSSDPVKIQRINQILSEQGKRLDELKGKTTAANSEFNKSFTGLNFQGLKNQFADLGKNIVGAFAVQQIIAFGAQSVKAFQEAERTALILKSAVGVSGGLQSDFEALVKQSNELQKTTIFSDDKIQQVQAAALQFGLTKDQVEELIPVVADFASATGQDLQTALDKVIQGINGAGRGLKEYGVTIDENGTRSSRLVEITEQLTRTFDGQAEAIGKTAVGAAEKYKNSLDDLQESIGERISPFLQGLRENFLLVADGAVFAAESIQNALENIFGVEIDLQELIQNASQANKELIADATNAFKSLADDELEAKLNVLTGAFEQAKEEAKGLSAEQAQSANKRIQEYATQIAAIKNIQAARRAGLGGFDDEETALKKVRDMSKLTDEELKKLLSTLNKFTSIDAKDGAEQVEKEIEARAKAAASASGKASEEEKRQREKALAELEQLDKKASDELLALENQEFDKITQLERRKQQEIQKIQDNFAKAGSPAESFDLMKRAIENVTRSYEILIGKEKELQEAQAKRRDDVFALANENEGAEQLQREIQNLDDATQQRINIKEREFLQIGNFSRAAQQELEADLLEIQRDAAQQELDILREKGQATLDAETKLLNAEKAIAQQRFEVQQELAEKRKELERQIADAVIDLSETIIFGSIDRELESRLDANDQMLEDTLDRVDREIDATELANERGIIGDREANRIKEDLLRQEQLAKEEADRKERQLKRKQFQTKQAAAVSEIIIANLVNASEFPLLAAYYAGLAIVQSALVLAEPNPYKKGTKSTQPGLSIVGEEGPELMYQPKGNKILSNPKTKANGAIIDAMFDNKLDEYIQKVYIKPELKRAEQEYEKELSVMLQQSQIAPVLKVQTEKAQAVQQEKFAMNIANSFMLNSDINPAIGKLIGKEVGKILDERMRRGFGLKEAMKPIAEAIKESGKIPSYKQ